MAQITFFLLQDLGGSRLPSSSPRPSIPPGGLQSSPISIFGAAASIPALVSLPPNTLSCASASPFVQGAPPHCRPLPSLFVPNLTGFIPLSIQGPQVPGQPSPSPCPATLGFSVSRPANPPCPWFPPSHLPAPSVPNFYITVPGLPGAGPPMPGSARSRRREEERQRETGGEPSWALPQRQPRLRVRPQTRPRPQTHPSTPSKDRAGVAVPRRPAPRRQTGVRDTGAEESAGELGERSWGAGDPAPAHPRLGASTPRRLSLLPGLVVLE